ncbi:hypothetical protein FRB91_008079, partial [Serendipita sp. 411]
MAPTTSISKKGIRIGSALKSGASKVIPGRWASGRPIAAIATPATGEQPVFILKVQILGCNGLLGVDRSGKSDPYVTVTLLQKQYQTPAINATLDPVFPPATSTFEFPIFSSLAECLGALELIVWDKNMVLKKEYIGEVSIPVEEWFPAKGLTFDDPSNTPLVRQLQSTKASRPAMGTIQVKLGIVPVNPAKPEVDQPYHEIVRLSQSADVSLASAPPTEGIGTVRSENGHELEDDGLMTDDDSEEDTEAEQPRQKEAVPLVVPSTEDNTTSATSAPSSRPSTPGKAKRPRFKRGSGDKGSTYNFGAEKDVLGIVLLEVNKAEDLPKLKNMTRTGWDMDPFVVVSFSRKVFRTRVLRHNLNPTWDEKLLFHVRRFEANYNIQLT